MYTETPGWISWDDEWTTCLGDRNLKKISRLFLFGALIVVLLTAACAAEEGATPTSLVGTVLPGDEDMTGTPFDLTETVGTVTGLETETGVGTVTTAETATGGLETPTTMATSGAATQTNGTQPSTGGTTQTPVVPVTGADVILVECQFCVDTRAHALLVLPDTATFEIVSPAPATTTSNAPDSESRCTTVEVNNGRQVVLCSGPEMTPLVVNICTDATTCTEFPVDLLACPLTQQPGNQPQSTPETEGTETTTTTTPGVSVSTATPLVTGTGTAAP